MFSPAPTQMPQFVFPHPPEYGTPGEHLRKTRDNHQYEPNPGASVDATPTQTHVGLDVTNEDISPFDRARAQDMAIHKSTMATQTDPDLMELSHGQLTNMAIEMGVLEPFRRRMIKAQLVGLIRKQKSQ
jgi:hypothetical protein